MQEKIEEIQETDLNKAVALPVQKQERIETLDILRGFALLGIFLIHMPVWFGSPAMYLEALGKNLWTSPWDTTAQSFIGIFALGKFYTMFAFLFGLGFVIFFERAKARISNPIPLFFKRLFILLIIGLLHAFFIWHGDVLVLYALFGFLLPAFLSRKPRTLIIWAVVFLSIFLLIVALAVLALGLIPDTMRAEMIYEMKSTLANSFYAYGEGNFSAIMAQRSTDVLMMYSNLLVIFFAYFPLFLLGVYVAKKGVFQNIEANLGFIKKAWIWGLIIGLPMSIVAYIASHHADHLFFNSYTLIQYSAGILGNTGLSIFYMTSIILLCRRETWASRFKPFAYVGRMALSNYLLQSIIGTLIFYSYGLGLYGQIAPAFGMVLALIIFAIQIIISKWWLEHYQFGPMEWTWKSLTYGKRFENKISK